MLVDGRNRLEACKRAKVKPKTVDLDGDDPVAFVLSANIHRRHMTKAQQAMAVAMVHPEPTKGGRGNKNSAKKLQGLNHTYITQARAVLRHLPQ
jgi:hypothetical protein